MTGERPKTYAKGPDTQSKSKRTQDHYKKQNRDQTSLTGLFGFTRTPAIHTPSVQVPLTNIEPSPPIVSTSKTQPPVPGTDALPLSGSHAQSASVLSDPSTDAGDCDDLIILADVWEVDEVEDQMPEAEEEGYESDLEEAIQGPKKTIKN